MPVKRRAAKRGRGLTENNRQALLYGPESILLGDFGDYYRIGSNHLHTLSAEVHEAARARMRADWEANREPLLEDWRIGPDDPYLRRVRRHGPDTLPWAAEQFGLPGEEA